MYPWDLVASTVFQDGTLPTPTVGSSKTLGGATNKGLGQEFLNFIPPSENLLRQVTYRSARYHCGQRGWTWREEGQQCCDPTAWHEYESLGSSNFMGLLALSPLIRSPSMRAVHWAGRPPPCRTQRGSGLLERARTSSSFLSRSGDCAVGKPILPRTHKCG